MKPDLATRLSATVVDGVGIPQADEIIRTFLAEIIRCAACDDTGSITVSRDVSIPAKDRNGQPVQDVVIEAGTVAPCPACGGPDNMGRARHDPEFTAWHCFAGLAERNCREVKDNWKDDQGVHAACGYKIILPLTLPPVGIGSM